MEFLKVAHYLQIYHDTEKNVLISNFVSMIALLCTLKMEKRTLRNTLYTAN